jgi:hypothetical protein
MAWQCISPEVTVNGPLQCIVLLMICGMTVKIVTDTDC